MIKRFAVLLSVALVATACSWPMAGQGASRRGWGRDETVITPANVATLTPSWTGAVGGSAEVLGTPNVVLTTGPSVRALDPGTGATSWTSSARTAAIRDSDAFTVSNAATCTLRRVSAATGVASATTTFGGPALPSPTVSLCGATGTLLDSDSVVVVPWVFASIGASTGCASGWVTSSGVTAFDGTLAPVWNRTVTSSGCGTPPADLLTRPRFGDVTRTTGHWVTTYGDSLVALPTGCVGICTPSWSLPITHPLGPALSLSKTTAALIDASGTVRVLDEATGAVVWAGSIGSPATSPLAATTARVFATGGGTLFAYRAGGCGTLLCLPSWTAPIGVTASQRASIGGDVVYVPGGSSVAAFDEGGCGAATCAALATLAAGSAVTGPPTVLNGRLLVPAASSIATFTLPS